MGLLNNQDYWANVANRMFDQRPAERSELMSRERALEIFSISCKSLTDLSNDPELASDLLSLKNRVNQEAPNGVSFDAFLGEFGRAEVAVAMQAGIDAGPAMAMGAYARRMADLLKEEEPGQFQPDLFLENLVRTRDSACAAMKEINAAISTVAKLPAWKRVWLGTTGVVIISTNIGVPAGTAIIEPISGATAGYLMSKSVKSGERLMSEAWVGSA